MDVRSCSFIGSVCSSLTEARVIVADQIAAAIMIDTLSSDNRSGTVPHKNIFKDEDEHERCVR